MGIFLFLLTIVATIFLLVIISRIEGIDSRLSDLQRQLARLEESLRPKPPPAPATKTPAHPTPATKSPEAEQPVTAVSPAEGDKSVVPAILPVAPAPPTPAPPSAVFVPPARPNALEAAFSKFWNWLVVGENYRKPDESWEYAAASHWLLRTGILIALAGVAFFLKYSIERGLLGPIGRISLILLFGLALIAVGVKMLFKRYHLLGQGLAGAGFVMLYFAFYAGAILYNLVPGYLAFALTAGVTVGAGALAVTYHSLGIALLGVVGGYATPLMFGDPAGNILFFQIYVLLLGVGILIISSIRRWPALNILGMLASYGLAMIVCRHHSTSALIRGDLIFLSCVHLLFLIAIVALYLRRAIMTTAIEWTALFFNALCYWGWIYLYFEPRFSRASTGLIALALAAVYFCFAIASLWRKRKDSHLIALFIAFGAFFAAMTPVFMLTTDWLSMGWSLLALIMAWLAYRTKQPTLAYASIVIFAFATLRCIVSDLETFYFHLRPWDLQGAAYWKAAASRFVLIGSPTASLVIARRFLRGHPNSAKVLGLALLLLWLYLSLEGNLTAKVFNPDFQLGAVTLVWMLFAFGLLFSGIRLRGKWLRWCGLGLFTVAVGKLLLVDLADLATLYRIIAFIGSGILLVLGSFLYLQNRSP